MKKGLYQGREEGRKNYLMEGGYHIKDKKEGRKEEICEGRGMSREEGRKDKTEGKAKGPKG